VDRGARPDQIDFGIFLRRPKTARFTQPAPNLARWWLQPSTVKGRESARCLNCQWPSDRLDMECGRRDQSRDEERYRFGARLCDRWYPRYECASVASPSGGAIAQSKASARRDPGTSANVRSEDRYLRDTAPYCYGQVGPSFSDDRFSGRGQADPCSDSRQVTDYFADEERARRFDWFRSRMKAPAFSGNLSIPSNWRPTCGVVLMMSPIRPSRYRGREVSRDFGGRIRSAIRHFCLP
jgi:hypothetical protein